MPAAAGAGRALLALFAATAAAIELAALAVQKFQPLVVETGAWQVALAGMMLVTLIGEIDFRRIVIAIYRNREANVQTILDRVIADNFAGVLVVDASGSVIAASAAAASILGTATDLVGSSRRRGAARRAPLGLSRRLVGCPAAAFCRAPRGRGQVARRHPDIRTRRHAVLAERRP